MKLRSRGVFALLVLIALCALSVLAGNWRSSVPDSRNAAEKSGSVAEQTSGGCNGVDGIFCDGFESETTSAWSGWSPRECAVPDVDLPVGGGE